MDKKLYHRGNGEVVQPKWRKPVRNKFSQSEAEMQMWEQELKEETKNWNEHICSLPIYAYCDPSNPVGWVEGEEVYQVRGNILGDWTIAGLDIWESVDDRYRRIWIEPVAERGIIINGAKGFVSDQPDFQREAEELYPLHDVFSKDERDAHIKAREMSAKEIEELKRENERLKMDNLKKETANGTKPVLCDVFKGKIATLKEDFLPESEHWETGYWHLKKGTQVYIQGNESDGTCYIEYIEAVFSIDYRQLNIA